MLRLGIGSCGIGCGTVELAVELAVGLAVGLAVEFAVGLGVELAMGFLVEYFKVLCLVLQRSKLLEII